VSPASITPTPQGAAFAITAGGAAGDYAFNLHAAGTDPASVTHDIAVALHSVDFTLSVPSPTNINVVPGAVSAPVALTASGAGTFTGQVTLSCLGLPTGTACQFQPSSLVAPTSSSPVSVSLTISTLITSPPGTYQVLVSATSPSGKTKMQLLILSVNFVPEYILAITNPSLTAPINSQAVFNGTLTSVNGYSGAVALTCGNGASANCVVNPSSVIPSDVGVPFTVTVSSPVSQAFAFNVNALGSDALSVAHSIPVTFSAMPAQTFDFTLSVTPPSVSIPSGQTATYTLDVSPTTGTFPSNVTFSCSGAPALTTFAFNPTQIGMGSGDSVITVTAISTAPTPAIRPALALCLTLPLATFFWTRRRCPKLHHHLCILAALVFIGFFSSSCGGGLQGNGVVGGSGSPGTPAGTYNLQINVSAASVSHSAQVKLITTQ
jgi:hypothetical protein